MMYRLAHISDVHLGPLPQPTVWELFSKRLTGYLNWKLNRQSSMASNTLSDLISHMKSAKPDHIAVTGDLVNLALPEEFSRMSGWLKDLGPPSDISVILGNHDAYVSGGFERAVEQWNDYLLDDDGATDPPFPYCRNRGNTAIIGVNSAEPTLPFMATGYFRQDQAERLAKMLDCAKQAGKFRVVMIHHPPYRDGAVWSKRLIGDDLFRDTIDRHGAELILHGHNHVNSLHWIDGQSALVPVVGVPAAGKSARPVGSDHSPGGRYNLYTIDGKAGAWSCSMQEFGYADGEKEISLIASTSLEHF